MDKPLPVLNAQWFDGRSSRARPARVRLVAGPDGTRLQLRALDGAGEALNLGHKQIGWPERWGTGRAPPRVAVDLGAHGSLQIDDVAGWQAALGQVSHRTSLAERMQTRLPVLLAVLVLAGAGVWAFYRWGTPWAATQLTRHVPLSWELRLTEQAMQEIDGRHLKPSKLPAARQAELRTGFDQLVALIGPELRRYPAYNPRLKLEFRSGMGANAFALPGGTIVMTDAMVEKARQIPNTGDHALLGVLAHEIGHVQHRHTTRMVVEQGVLNIGLGLALGDVSTLVSSGASLLTGLAYRRNHEAESDCYAAAMMRKAGLPTAPMADLLLGIDGGVATKRAPKANNGSTKDGDHGATAPDKAAERPASGGGMDWLSTHPDTHGRAQRLREGTPQGC
ncbi:MAG: M48 family metallopeptidase [Pseudomonadota bacterium]|nr:M48 family metallopeptidase [Pseudomonadota bacterium]